MIRRLVGWYRLLWGYCPACNSDAPAIDSCYVCRGITGEGVPAIKDKPLAWERFTR